MKKRTTVIALLLALTMLATCLLAGCGGKTDTTPGTTKADTTTKADDTKEGTTVPVNTNGTISLSKVGSIDQDYISIGSVALEYKENDKEGILTFDGKKDTGAIYAGVSTKGNYIVVTTAIPEDENDLDAINSDGLMDGEGNLVIPAQYAVFDVLSDRYVQACTAKELVAADAEDYLLYLSSSMFSFGGPSDGDPRYSGEWVIYDLTTGKPVPGVSGTNRYAISVYGNIIKYVTENEEYRYVNEKGEDVDSDPYYMENGCYVDSSEGVLYDSEGNKVFSFDPNGFIPKYPKGDYYIAGKSVNGNSTYVLMDDTGKVISGEFTDYSPKFTDKAIFSEGDLFDYSGNKLTERTYKYGYLAHRGLAFVLYEEDDYALYDAEGKLIYACKNDSDNIYIDSSNYIVRKEQSDSYYYSYYCWKDADFTIKDATSAGEFLVKTNKGDDTFGLVDTITGEEILNGYADYKVATLDDGDVYIYGKTADATWDVFVIN